MSSQTDLGIVDTPPRVAPMRTGELTHMVIDKYGGENGAANLGKYIVLTQVSASTGGSNNIADVMALGAWHSSGNLLEGFEVKVSRADWLNEVKNPAKCQQNKRYCHHWWLVIADASMVKEGELPDDWGMMSVVNGQLKVIKRAPMLKPEPLSIDFVASLLRTDARETIPMDVHNDKMKDHKRDVEAQYKKQYGGLLQFVKDLHKELGIEIREDGSADKKGNWYARVGSFEIQKLVANGGWNLTPVQLAAAIKIVLSRDMGTIKYRLESVAEVANELLKITKEFNPTQHKDNILRKDG